MKFIRVCSNNSDCIYQIGDSDSIILLNKNSDKINPSLVLNKKDFIVELDDGTSGHADDIYEEICRWLSTGKSFGEVTDLFTIDIGSVDDYIKYKNKEGE